MEGLARSGEINVPRGSLVIRDAATKSGGKFTIDSGRATGQL
jgi:hypothetical protein